jgi:fructose-bisphosphate aldolase class II
LPIATPDVYVYVSGAVALAGFAYVVAAKLPTWVALHTDHCPKDALESLARV